jgi:hypothetical protein
MERETGIEPATNSLEGCDSTTELLPHSFCFNALQCHKVAGRKVRGLGLSGFGLSLRIDFTLQIYHSLPGRRGDLLHVHISGDFGL